MSVAAGGACAAGLPRWRWSSPRQALTARHDEDRVIDLRMRLLGPRGVDDLLATLAEQPGIVPSRPATSTVRTPSG